MKAQKSFADQRLAATREFAHTLIVVDDEAWKTPSHGPAPRGGLRSPRRGRSFNDEAAQQEMFLIRHALDTEKLVDAAMNLGLVCSVIRPPKGKSIKAQISSVARRADIVCLDWELHEDAGNSATSIIVEIARQDEKRDGRLRLIAIYTGDMNNNQILEKVFNAFPGSYRDRFELKRDAVRIESNHGLRIVCLFKAHGVQLADARKDRQVKEGDLPERLQKEFSLLAGGLLSNVALATIASIRDSTHHILSKMTETMDAPYFHHRSVLPLVGEAEEYGVDIVLSDLKSAVDKRGVAHKYAGKVAIASRIREMAKDAATLRLRFDSNGVAKEFDVNIDDAIALITEGAEVTHKRLLGPEKPGVKVFERAISTLFAKDAPAAQLAMRQFAVLTSVRAHPGSPQFKNGINVPHLGLGTIIQNSKKAFLLCLQASCDSVRVKKRAAFLFVPLNASDKPEHFVPMPLGKNLEFVGLSTPGTAYAQSVSLVFEPDIKSQTVLAKKLKGRRGLYFQSSDGEVFRWIADLKQRRALRTAQRLGQSMGRLGFDEFEPFRAPDS